MEIHIQMMTGDIRSFTLESPYTYEHLTLTLHHQYLTEGHVGMHEYQFVVHPLPFTEDMVEAERVQAVERILYRSFLTNQPAKLGLFIREMVYTCRTEFGVDEMWYWCNPLGVHGGNMMYYTAIFSYMREDQSHVEMGRFRIPFLAFQSPLNPHVREIQVELREGEDLPVIGADMDEEAVFRYADPSEFTTSNPIFDPVMEHPCCVLTPNAHVTLYRTSKDVVRSICEKQGWSLLVVQMILDAIE